jgi:hypothetical protein
VNGGEKKAASVAVDGEGRKQTRTINQPRLILAVNVQHEHEIFGLQIAADRRVVAHPSPKDRRMAEVHDVASAWIVRPAQDLAEGLRIEVADNRDLPPRMSLRDFGELVERQPDRANTEPTTAHPGENVCLGRGGLAPGSEHVSEACRATD